MFAYSYRWILKFRANTSNEYVITDIIRYLMFCRLKGLNSAIVLVTLKHITRNMLNVTATFHMYAQATHPYSLENQGPGCRFEDNEIPTGRIAMLIKMSFPVIIM